MIQGPLRARKVMARRTQYLSRETPRIDALERVTGQANYTEDISLPGMLFARVLRSPHPHALVRSIDTSRAEALPGVMAILHCRNNDTLWNAGDRLGRRRLFAETVRFVGEAVAAVAAVDRHIAEEALHLIRIDYEELPFVLRVEEALKEGSPKLFADGNVKKGDPEIYESGNVEEGFRQADFVYENDFASQHHNNAQLERRVTMAQWDGDRLTVWASTQGIHLCRSDIAENLRLPLSKVRVISQYMGSGFGGKIVAFDFDLMAALLAKRTGRPVRVEMTRREDFIAVHGRWSTQQHYRIGVKKDGAITALDMKGTSGMGGYLRRPGSGGIMTHTAYSFPTFRTEVTRVFSNISCGANFRAPTGPQGVFALESALDDIAARLEMDPVAFRLKHIVKEGWGPKKNPLLSNGLPECIQRGAEAIGWTEKRKQYAQQTGPVRRGVGMGVGAWGAGLRPSSAAIKIFPDGSIKAYVGVTDVGTGAKTTMGLIAAEALGVPLEAISVVSGDSEVAPYSTGESGSSTTGSTGGAVIEAARQVREQLLAQAAIRLKAKREDLDLRGGKIVNTANANQSWPIAEVTSKNIDAITAFVTTQPPGDPPQPDAFVPDTLINGSDSTQQAREGAKARIAFAAHFAEVEVNLETGMVKVLRYVAAHDSGTIVNKLTAASQVKGGVAQGISMALREELIWDRITGIPVNNYFHGAKPLLHPETPDVEVIWVETEDPLGPYGSKALGEIPIVPVVGAVANAICHSTGLRMRELPITPDKILTALANGEGRKT
jgi:xanthine dehydrogenase molybdenum-binding subunit